MFLKHDDHPVFADLSLNVRDSTDWKIGVLKDFEFPLDITTVAFDPVSCLLAIGTSGGAIYLHGGPGVETKLLLPEAIPVRFLQFGLPTERLVCLDLDNAHQMHIWDLSPLGSPKHMGMVRWDPATFMVLSPSHDHIFVALSNGDLRTYDLACMRKSPYTLPNLWRLHQEKMLKLGLSQIHDENSGLRPVELLPHPRNLGLLFIAYEGGVVLADLRESKVISTYELILPPGAPGGAGYGTKNILLPRRMSVTSVAIHPAGHFFAVGHTDGTIAFWAIEDPEQPILVRTLEDLDVNMVNAEMLEAQLDDPAVKDSSPQREPIFKLLWSGFTNSKDPRGGETALTILGGVKPEGGFGLNVLWFPPFNPSDPPATSPPVTQDGLHPFMSAAIRQSLKEKGSFLYSTSTPVQDFYLIPRASPHFNYAYDPETILILVEAPQTGRILESREFPPPSLSSIGEHVLPARSQAPVRGECSLDFNEMLESLSLVNLPQPTGLPFEFCGGNFIAHTCRLMVVPKDLYSQILESTESPNPRPRIKLTAGCARMEPSLEVKRIKHELHRVLICPSRNLTIDFYDISGQFLQVPGDTPLLHDFPKPIDTLEIDLRAALDVFDNNQPSENASVPVRSITAIHFVPATLECAIVLSSGELLVYHPRSIPGAQKFSETQEEELQLLKNVAVEPWRKLVPYFALRPVKGGSIICSAVSEIGFVAVSYDDGSLFVVDMRGPTVLHKSTKPVRSSRHSLSFHHLTDTNSGADIISSLTWSISGIDKDSRRSIRLIAMHDSGNMDVYTITQSTSGFTLEPPISISKVMPNPIPEGSFVINSKTGVFCKADRRRFADMLQSTDPAGETVIFVTSGTKGVRSFVNITGERIGKAEWGTKLGEVICVQIVERLGSQVFVAYTAKNALHVYSLPYLEHVHTIPVLSTPLRSIIIDESGDFVGLDIQTSSGLVQSATYGTLFNFRRAGGLPLLDFVSNRGRIPPQPQPVSIGPSSFRSWFQSNQTMSGQQIDEHLSGPDRPAPVKRARDVTAQREDATYNDTYASSAAAMAAAAANAHSNIYNRLTTALNERGQMLGDLEENFKSLEQGSKDMASQAKRLAAQNTAKSWFGF